MKSGLWVKPRLYSSHLLRREKPCCPASAGLYDFVSQHIYYYAFGAKSLQVHVSLGFFNRRDDAYNPYYAVTYSCHLLILMVSQKVILLAHDAHFGIHHMLR
jgi:hypothetical protein